MTSLTEKRFLQSVVVIACLVPLLGGGYGILRGAVLVSGAGADIGSHLRYLSGLLFAIGLAFLTCVAKIERQGHRFTLLTALVVVGGLTRLLGFFLAGIPSAAVMAALAMELLVTPALCLWQRHLAARFHA